MGQERRATMTCALCHGDDTLLLSHVIPEFLYRQLYDDKHQLHLFSSEDSKPRRFQKGIRERLLCARCEKQLSKYERYASLVFSGRIPVWSQRKGNLIRIEGLDYKRFRLFGLSVLWRAGVSKHRMFESVRLGRHEEVLRQLVLREDPGRPDQYGSFLSPLVQEGADVLDLMGYPTRARLDNHLCYHFVFGGLIWTFVVSRHQLPRVRDAFVNEKGEMRMLVFELKDVPFILRGMNDMMDRIGRA